MAGYIGSGASVVSSGAENKKVFDITTNTTSLTGLNYTVGKVHVYHNGVRLVDGTDYTATNSTSITLTVAAVSGDQVVVVSYASFQLSEHYTKAETDTLIAGAGSTPSIDDNGNATAITIDSSENVGIGTSSPTAKLNVAGATSGDYLAKIESTNQFGLKIKTTSTSDSHEQFAIHDGNNNAQFKVMGGGTVHATGINLGGSGSANRLNDYEEGTWTPTQGNVSPWTSPTFSARYTKVGRLVRVQVEQTGGTIGMGGYMGGLPFNPSTAGNKGIGNASNGGLNNLGTIFAYAQNQIWIMTGGSNQTNLIFGITYFTDD